MQLLLVAAVMVAIALIFFHALFVGAPFLPVRNRYVEQCLDMLDLKPGQQLLDLGSGDGRVLIAAARRGANSIGYEINPLLFAYSWLLTRRYRKQIQLVYGNYWDKPLPRAEAIYVFLLQPYMARLDEKLKREITEPTKLLSFAFYVSGKKSLSKVPGIYLYQY